MLYNPLLDTFLIIVESGSINKASQLLYISPAAVLKQLDTLEDKLNLKLFTRNRSGCYLTKTGQIVFEGAKRLKKESDLIVKKAKESNNVVRIGFNDKDVLRVFFEAWKLQNNSYNLSLVSLKDVLDYKYYFDLIGEHIDMFVCVDDFYVEPSYEKKILDEANFILLVPKNHKNANKKQIKIKELNEDIFTFKKGFFKKYDWVSDYIINSNQKIKGIELGYDNIYTTINKSIEDNRSLLCLDILQNVHPDLVPVKLDSNFKVPISIFYKKESEYVFKK